MMVWLTIWLMFGICEITLFNHDRCNLCYRSTACTSRYKLSWTILFSITKYMVFGYGVFGIWILFNFDMTFILWHCIILHCIALAYGVMSRTYGSEIWHLSCGITVSFIGHNDAVSFLIGYEGRSSYTSMCIHHWFGIEMQLHILMGMKAGVHVHWYAFFYRLMLDVMEICCYTRILCL